MTRRFSDISHWKDPIYCKKVAADGIVVQKNRLTVGSLVLLGFLVAGVVASTASDSVRNDNGDIVEKLS